MNERIRAIADEAYKHALAGYCRWSSDSTFDGVPHIRNLYTEKFAELLVRECADFLKDTLDDHFAAEQLEEHFGVEE